MNGSGEANATFQIRRADAWNVWLQGETMPPATVRIDGQTIGRIGGDELVPTTMTALGVRLSKGRHRLTLKLNTGGLTPGAGGSAYLSSIFLAPAGIGEQQQLRSVPPARWRSLCGHRYVWIETVPG